MTRDEVALQIFCAMLAQPRVEIDLYPALGEKQVRVSFALAETFLTVAVEAPAETVKDTRIPFLTYREEATS